MSIPTQVTAFFEAQWTPRLVDTCTIDRTTSEGSLNTVTGEYLGEASTNLYTGVCLWRGFGRQFAKDTVADTPASTSQASVMVPNTVTGLQRDDTVTIVTAQDSDAVGAWQIISVEADSYAHVRELIVDKIEKSGWPR
jgi:hypothetical protein